MTGQRRGDAVHGTARDEHDPADPALLTGLEEKTGPGDVHLVVYPACLRHRQDGRQMEYDLHVPDGPAQDRGVPDVPLDEVGRPDEPGLVGRLPVQDTDGDTLVLQTMHEL